MALTTEQIAEMRKRLRAESEAGRPEISAGIQAAIDAGEFYEDPEVEEVAEVEQPPISGPGSGKAAWVEYARSISDIDDEVLDSITREDILAMLRANGLVPMPEADEVIEVDESDDDE